MRAAILFDIDGTLLKSAGAGATALSGVLAQELGLSTEQVKSAMASVDFRGATDHGIFQRLGHALGVSLNPLRERLARSYFSALEHQLRTHPVEVLPGVHSLLQTLSQHKEVYVGILTGNLRAAARLKLRAIGHEGLVNRAGGFGEDGLLRNHLAVSARQRLGSHGVAPNARIIVVGDTEHDVSCGKHIGATTVAVATGWTEWTTLEASRPDVLLKDLSDPSALLALL